MLQGASASRLLLPVDGHCEPEFDLCRLPLSQRPSLHRKERARCQLPVGARGFRYAMPSRMCGAKGERRSVDAGLEPRLQHYLQPHRQLACRHCATIPCTACTPPFKGSSGPAQPLFPVSPPLPPPTHHHLNRCYSTPPHFEGHRLGNPCGAAHLPCMPEPPPPRLLLAPTTTPQIHANHQEQSST